MSIKVNNECIYCGATDPTTNDHVPPRSFYPYIPPKDLIKVPSCLDCNKTFAKNDDYVRLVLTLDEKARGNADRDEVLPKVLRSAKREQARGLLATFYESLRWAYRQNPKGIYVRGQCFNVEHRD
jgi:hypothetical protein